MYKKAYSNQQQSIIGDPEGNNLGCNRRADRCAKEYSNGLPELQKPGVYKTDKHDSCSTAALNNHCNKGTHDQCNITVIGKPAENASHLFAGRFLQTLAHDHHPEEKQAKPSDKVEQKQYEPV